VRLPFPPEFRQEWAGLGFRFCCEDCAHFDPTLERCVHGWPHSEHRLAFYEDPACRELVYCKEFELR
jgi:hypothetical protein